MIRKFARNAIATILVGVGYWYIYVNLVGIAAAIAMPDWYISFAYDHKTLSLVLFGLVTTIPAAALFTGFVMAKLVTERHLLYGISIVICVTAYSVFTTRSVVGPLETLRHFVVPGHVGNVAGILAWWLFLPLSAWYFAQLNVRE